MRISRHTYIRQPHRKARKPQTTPPPDNRAFSPIPHNIDPAMLLGLIVAERIYRETAKRRGHVELYRSPPAVIRYSDTWTIEIYWMGCRSNITPHTLHKFMILQEE